MAWIASLSKICFWNRLGTWTLIFISIESESVSLLLRIDSELSQYEDISGHNRSVCFPPRST